MSNVLSPWYSFPSHFLLGDLVQANPGYDMDNDEDNWHISTVALLVLTH